MTKAENFREELAKLCEKYNATIEAADCYSECGNDIRMLVFFEYGDEGGNILDLGDYFDHSG